MYNYWRVINFRKKNINNMLKFKYVLLLMYIPFFMACSPKTTGTKSKPGTHTEDLSRYRPPASSEEVGETVVPEEMIKTPTANLTPVNDITYQLDNTLDSLEVRTGDRTVQGYTIQVYSGNSREAANEAKSLVYKLFPESRPETTYIQPNYKVKVGKYLSRLEAQKLYAKLKNDFAGAMVIPEKITLTRF
jgi:hypothetical protein